MGAGCSVALFICLASGLVGLTGIAKDFGCIGVDLARFVLKLFITPTSENTMLEYYQVLA